MTIRDTRRLTAVGAVALLALCLAAGCKPAGPPEKDPVHAGDGFSTRPGRGTPPTQEGGTAPAPATR
jgi:hypothetical protein